MVHNSIKPIEREIMLRIYQLFFNIVRKSSNKDNFVEIITDFISPSEQVMIAKRIAILYLLIKGIKHSAIVNYLNVSSATVAKFALLFYEKDTKSILVIKSLIKQGKVLAFLDDIFYELFTQPGVMRGHWQRYWDHERQKVKRKMLDV